MHYTNSRSKAKDYSYLEAPDDHLKLITRGLTQSPHGTVLVGWRPMKTPRWFKTGLAHGQDQLSRFTNDPDIYLTPNCFHNWRLIRLLKGLNAFFIDLDDHKSRKPDLIWMFSRAQVILHELGWPQPNAVIYSGRGIHLYWLLDNVPAQALPRWKAVQRTLCLALGGDRHAVDPTRLLRVVGTQNSKTGHKVTGEQFFDTRYDFNTFCDQVLPHTQAEVRDFRVRQARANRKKKTHNSTRKWYGSIYDRWYLVYQDLLRIQNHFWFGGMQEAGHRDLMLFHTANALSWFTHSDALVNEIKATAKIMTPSLRMGEALSYCTSIINRARRTRAEPEEEHRYRYARKTLWQEFEPIIGRDPELVHSLRAIIPDELRTQRQTERNRVKEGRYTKSRDTDGQKRMVQKMLSQGFKQVHIAKKLGLSAGRVSQIAATIKNKR